MRYFSKLFLSLILLASSTAYAMAEYPMQCTGGGEMFANYYPEANYIEVHFMKAPQGANAATPGPGECAWMDRPINDAEPFWFRFDLPSSEHIDRIILGPGTGGVMDVQIPVTVDSRPVGVVMEVQGNALSTLINAMISGGRCTMQSSNEGGRHFIARQLLC